MSVESPDGVVRSHESSRILPFHKEFVAHFTGRWPEGYQLRWKRKPWWHLLMMLISLSGGVAASSLIILGSPVFWPFLILSWMLTVHGARKGQVVINHHAVHTNVTGHKLYDQLLAEMVSTVLVIQDYLGYFWDHVRVHHGPKLATPEDPDLRFLLVLGFRPGMSREALWRRLYWTVVSPRFHYLFLVARFKANYVTAPVYRRIMSGCYAVAVVVGLIFTGAWLPWLIAWVFPVFFLYHIAALLQFICEHRWLMVQESTRIPEERKMHNDYGKIEF